MAGNLHISISAEPIYILGPLQITNSMFTGVIVSALIVLFALYFAGTKKNLKTISRMQAFVELIIEGLFKLCVDIAGEKKTRVFFPLIATATIFILLNNWFGLLPGVGTIGLTHDPREAMEETHLSWGVDQVQAVEEEIHGTETVVELEPGEEGAVLETHAESEAEEEHHVFIPIFRAATADLNTTLALALISMGLVQFYGIKYLGLSYFTKFFNFKQGPVFTFVGLLELLSEFSKVISFAFRLFGNIFAGEVLLAVIGFLVPVLLPIPFLGLEIFVGVIQAIVFAMLTLVFINMATISHDH